MTSILQNIEAEAEKIFSTAWAEAAAFVAKVQSGAQVIIAEVDSAIEAVASHIGEIDSVLQSINTNLPKVVAFAQTAGVPQSDLAILQSAAKDAGELVTGLNAGAAALSKGSGDVGAVMSAIQATAAASQSTSKVVQALAQLPVPTATQAVTPASPPATA